jgi:hypothetical protein
MNRRIAFGMKSRKNSARGDENFSFSESSSRQSSGQGSQSRWSLKGFKQSGRPLSKPTETIVFTPLLESAPSAASDLESLSYILGGPNIPPGNFIQREPPEENQPESESESPAIQLIEDDATLDGKSVNQTDDQFTGMKSDSMTIHVEERSVIESDIRALEEEYVKLESLSSKSKSGSGTTSWKRSMKRLHTTGRSIASKIQKAQDSGGEVLEHGTSLVVIHCETQNANGRQRRKEEDESVGSSSTPSPTVDTTKRKSRLGPIKRFKGIASAVKRAIKPDRFIHGKKSHFDNLSTDSSSSSEVGISLASLQWMDAEI